MKFKIVFLSLFGASALIAKEAPLEPAWKVRNSTNQSITVKPFFKSKQPKFNSDEQSYAPLTIAPGNEQLVEFDPGLDGSFYYTPSRLEISAGAQKLDWSAPKDRYYLITIELKDNKLQVTTKDWPFNDIMQRKLQVKKEYPNRDKYYSDDFKPRLDKYLKTH